MINKNRFKTLTYGFEVRVSAIISNGLVHRVPKRQTLILMRKELDKFQNYAKLSNIERNRLWQNSYARYVKISKQTFSSLRRANSAQKGTKDYEQELKLRQNIVYEKMKGEFKAMEVEKNDVANEYEFRHKHDSLREQFETGIFYLCSTHENPAKDHADWEGKVYVHEDWAERIGDDVSLASRIRAYIRNHKTKTVQWVTGEPVWLITRPNCKHYLTEVSVEEVLGSSVKSLLKRHKLYMPDEVPMTYEYEQYKVYYERLKMMNYLKEMCPSDSLRADIKRTGKLVTKWREQTRTVLNKNNK